MADTWAYLIIFSRGLGTRKEVQDFLDNQRQVTYWFSCLPNCVFFTSTLSAEGLAERVIRHFGEGGTFLVTEVHADREGWLPEEAWHLFQHPHDPRIDDED